MLLDIKDTKIAMETVKNDQTKIFMNIYKIFVTIIFVIKIKNITGNISDTIIKIPYDIIFDIRKYFLFTGNNIYEEIEPSSSSKENFIETVAE